MPNTPWYSCRAVFASSVFMLKNESLREETGRDALGRLV